MLKFTQQAAQAEANLSALKAAVEDGGFFAVNTGADGKFAVGLTDAGKDHFAAELGTVRESLQAAIEAKNGVQAKLDGAPGAERGRIAAAVDGGGLFKLAFDDAGAPSLSLSAADGFFALAPGADGKLALSLTDAGKVQFVNDEATRLTASTGHKQMPLKVDTTALGNGGAATDKTGAGRTKSTWNK